MRRRLDGCDLSSVAVPATASAAPCAGAGGHPAVVRGRLAVVVLRDGSVHVDREGRPPYLFAGAFPLVRLVLLVQRQSVRRQRQRRRLRPQRVLQPHLLGLVLHADGHRPEFLLGLSGPLDGDPRLVLGLFQHRPELRQPKVQTPVGRLPGVGSPVGGGGRGCRPCGAGGVVGEPVGGVGGRAVPRRLDPRAEADPVLHRHDLRVDGLAVPGIPVPPLEEGKGPDSQQDQDRREDKSTRDEERRVEVDGDEALVVLDAGGSTREKSEKKETEGSERV